MLSGSVAFFERLAASPGTELFRVGGRIDPLLLREAEPVLIVDDGARAHEYGALPVPGRVDLNTGAFVLPFTVPTALLSRRVAYALRLDGDLLDLPAPEPRKLKA